MRKCWGAPWGPDAQSWESLGDECILYGDGTIRIGFDDFSTNSFMVTYSAIIEPKNSTFRFDKYTMPNPDTGITMRILSGINFYKIKPKP